MAITALHEDSATIGTTEYSLPADANYSSGSPQTSDGVFQVWLDMSALTSTEEYQLRVYEKVQSGGTQRVVYEANYFGPIVPTHVALPTLILMHGWDVTLDKIAGTDRSVGWSIRQVS